METDQLVFSNFLRDKKMKGVGITARGITATSGQNFVNMRLGTRERGRRERESEGRGGVRPK